MCQKRQRHCAEYARITDDAYAEWCRAEALEQVRAAWGRMGGRVTAHRYGPDHFRRIRARRVTV